MLRAPVNGGFAYATNRALEVLLADPALDLFWVLNPDARAAPDAAAHYARAGADGNFALMGGRTLFAAHDNLVQTDGGRVSRFTGLCSSVNWNVPLAEAPLPDAASLDFITGANLVASRRFCDQAGLMREDYFLYYEEVDWAQRRGDLPLRFVPEAVVTHHGGTSIGTGSVGRRPSPFANYFNHRGRMRFMLRFNPLMLPVGVAYGMAKAAQLLLLGAGDEARALLAGMFGLGPPAQVRATLSPDAQRLAFGRSDAVTRVVLNFHGLGTPHRAVPESEVPYWFGRERFAGLLDQIAHAGLEKQVALTFDDGNASDLAAAEMLAERGMMARFFVLVGRLGQPGYLAAGELAQLREAGMLVGLHGRDHVDWRKLDAQGWSSETITARAELAEHLGEDVAEVAIPFGAYDRAALTRLRRQGFTRIHTSDPGRLDHQNAHIWNRNTLRSDMDEAQIARIMAGRWTAHERARQMARNVRRRLL